MAHTTEDYTVELFGDQRATIIIPAETPVELVDHWMGLSFAVDMSRLTGNNHDPKYRYVFVPNSIVAA